jgi:hypothetical protein
MLTPALQAAVPQVLNHQGRIAVDGINFDGAGQFKFALVDATGSTTFWSNDGTSNAGSQPTAAVSLSVVRGLYSVLLGDASLPNMTAVPASVFANTNVRLRVWFNDGSHGFQLISPDQRLAASPYALVAENAALATSFSGSLAGDVSGTQSATSIAAPTVTGKLLTGYVSGAGSLLSADDTILSAFNKLDSNSKLKANLDSPTFTGMVEGTFSGPLTGNVTGSVSGSAATFTGSLSGDVTGTQSATAISAATVTGKALTGYVSGAGTLSASDTILTAINKLNGNVALKADLASPTFTGTVSGITASMVGLGNVNNTSDANKPVSTAQQAALDLKASLASPTFTGTVSGITSSMVGLGSVNNTSDASKPVSTAQQTALDLKADLASPTFTGTVSGITASMVGLGNVSNTSDASKPVSTAQQAALNLKANLTSPTFTGTVQLPTGTASAAPLKLATGVNLTTPVFGSVEFDGTNLFLTNNSASPTRKTLAFTDAPTFSGTTTGTFSGPLTGNVTGNVSGSAASFTGLLSGDVTGTQSATAISAITVTGKSLTGYVSGAGTISASDTILTAINKLNGNVALKADLASPTFTGTVSGINASMVGLGNVSNTSDANKPVSTAQQAALDLKASLANPTFTGTVSGITKTMVGLGSVNNTSDANKPVSTAQQAALDLKANLASPTFSGTVSLPAGTAFSAPMKLTAGANLASASFGAVEFDGTNLYLTTNSASPTRKTLAFSDSVPTTVPAANLTTAPIVPVLAWGNNRNSQTTMPALANVAAVAAGESHSLVLLDSGTVIAQGLNTRGQVTVPVGLTGVTEIAAGASHNLVRKSDGTLVAWGDNSYGQTTLPSGITTATRVAAGEKHSLALLANGSVRAWGDNSFGQTTLPASLTGATITAIAAGSDHSLALKSDGTVIAWGRDDAAQVTLPSGLVNVVAIAAGAYHSLALKSDGTVIAWGWDGGGQVTVPAGLSGVSKIAGGYAFSMALKTDGTLVLWGDNSDSQTTIPAAATQVTHIAAGASHALALRADAIPAQVALLDQDNVFTGKVGIKRTPAVNSLEVEGSASKTTAGSWLSNSDRRIKTEIQSITGALQKLDQVRLVDFRYTDEYRAAHPSIADVRYPNVIAQEFAEVFPDDVKNSGEVMADGSPILQVDTYPLIIYSAAAVQELNQENQKLKKQLVNQEKQLVNQEKQLADQEKRLRKLEALLGE